MLLQELVQQESCILLDTSAIGFKIGKRKTEVHEIKELLETLNSTNHIHVLPETQEELRILRRNLNSKTKRLTKLLTRVNKNYRDIKQSHSEVDSKRAIISKLVNYLGKIELDFESIPKYRNFRDIIFLLEDRLKLKGRYKTFEKKNDREDLRTDEKLVAAAFYLTTFRDKGVAIASNDSDIMVLLKYCYFILTKPVFKPENERLRDSLKTKGVRLYAQFDGPYKKTFDSTTFNYGFKVRLDWEDITHIRKLLNHNLASITH